METTKGERIRLGIFMAITVLLVLGFGVFFLGKRLSNENVMYHTRFSESVDGLVPGAKVKWNGVDVGKVLELHIDEHNLLAVVVTFEVAKGTPIKASMRANLVGGFSITGLKTIELSGGNPDEPTLPENHEILAGTSQIQQITSRVEIFSVKLEALMNNMLLITGENNQANLAGSLQDLHSVTTQFRNSDIEKTFIEIQNASKALETLSKRADLMIYKSQEDISTSLRNINEMTENMYDFSQRIKADPSLLIRSEEKSGRIK